MVVCYAFTEKGLHRIEAGVMPRNIASIRVPEKAGLIREGRGRKNPKIHSPWEDRV
nr:GNAT family protein [Polycladomyces sp. WAk]